MPDADATPTDLVHYRIPETTIDGRPFTPGTEVRVTVLAHVREEQGSLVLHICDWSGPDSDVSLRLAAIEVGGSPLVRAERAIVRALKAAGFGEQSQVTRSDGFEIATGGVIVRVEVNPDA